MQIISSQRYINNKILNEKIEWFELNRPGEIILPVWDVDGDMAVLGDGHHTLEAARQVGVSVCFIVVEHPEGLYGDNLLENSWIDSDWYDITTGELVF